MKIIPTKENKFVVITPAEAQEIYDNRHKNRPVNIAKVKQYSKAMLTGRWKPCTTLSFLDDRLEDGQHRMLACVRSGVNFEGYVHRHNDPTQFAIYDTGKNRNNSDVLAVAGVKYYKLASSSLQVLNEIHSFTGLTPKFGGGKRIETYEVEEIYSKFPDLEASCEIISKGKKFFKVPGGSAVALHYLLRKNEIGLQDTKGLPSFMTDKFISEHLLKGYGLYEGHPVSTFRNYISRCYSQDMKGVDRMTHFAMVHGGIATWNKWIRGKSMTRLKIKKSNHLPGILKPQK